MRHRNVLKLTTITAALSLLGLGLAQSGARAQLVFSPSDWLLHRGSPDRVGSNGDPGLPLDPGTAINPGQPVNPALQMGRVWVYPATKDMPAEIVVDNDKPLPPFPAPNPPQYPPSYSAPPAPFTATPNPPPVETDTGQRWGAFPQKGTWAYAAGADRVGGAWPPSAGPQDDAETGPQPHFYPKAGDYWWAYGRTSPGLATIGITTLAELPDLGETFDPTAASNTYKIINDLLDETKLRPAGEPPLEFSRWSFGDRYPVGTQQGTNVVSVAGQPGNPPQAQAITPNQRYAVYIRYPASGTFVGGEAHPNVDHAMVRVSWGQNVNDPITSRIFMVDFGGTGGGWIRLRTGAGDDRYFPYAPDANGKLWPIRVTLYTATPDDVSDNTLFGAAPLVPADSVRLVPEALRGDIHAPAVSAHFPLQNAVGTRNLQLTYFGRDETTGPVYVNDINKLKNTSFDFSGFTLSPFNPTLPPQTDPNKANFNPLIGDPTSSIRSAVFYCIQDDLNAAAPTYGKLLWRYPARTSLKSAVTVDNSDGPPTFTTSGAFAPGSPNAQSYGPDYLAAQVTDPAANKANTANWQAGLPDTAQGGTWSVFVWIPADLNSTAAGSSFAHHATYTIQTDAGPMTVQLDQRNVTDQAPPNPPAAPVGEWRQLAGGLKFPAGTVNGTAYSAVGSVTLTTDSAQDIAEPGGAARVVVADAVQFVSESRTPNSVVASPLLADVKWPSGTERQVVYFGTTDGHVWALDALGPLGQANQQATTTSAYWVYPSVSSPGLAYSNPGTAFAQQYDPNLLPDPFNNVPSKGIDGDLVQTTVNGQPVFTLQHQAPILGAFNSSPAFFTETDANGITTQYVVLGNANGRLYAIDAVGRVNTDPNIGPVNEPFPNTFAAGDNPGIPGTSRRLMTWPTIARDKWLRDQAAKQFSTYADDPGKGSIDASPTLPTSKAQPDYAITGAADGHVYAVALTPAALKPNERISNSQKGNKADGTPVWQYPDTLTQLDPIDQPGAWSPEPVSGANLFVFSAGGRVYAIHDPPRVVNTKPVPEWVYPFSATPPGNPANTDQPETDLPFTAPALRAVSSFNGGKLSAFVANQDGTLYAFDATVTGNAANPPLWSSFVTDPTRASVVFLNNLNKQFTTDQNGNPIQVFPDVGTQSGPALLLPTDAGGIQGFQITAAPGNDPITGLPFTAGRVMWQFFDSSIGAVPITDTSGNIIAVPTSVAWRGADATTANTWILNGDEGNQATGEMNGQMRAYAQATIGMVTGGEPNPRPSPGSVTINLVDLWNSTRDPVPAAQQVWDFFGSAVNGKSPYNEVVAGNRKTPAIAPAQQKNNGIYVYELGDTIYAAAWGTYQGTLLPQVTFTKEGPGTTVSQLGVVAQDLAYSGPPLPPGTNAWVAKIAFELGRPSQNDPQTPGSRYRISAQATLLGQGGGNVVTPRLYNGQYMPSTWQNGRYTIDSPPFLAPNDPRSDPNELNPSSFIVLANPLALTTRGPAGAGLPNVIGWTTNVAADDSNLGTAATNEIVGNGNTIAQFDPNTNLFVPQTLRDLVAPLGLVAHGSSGAYVGVDNNGATGPALYVADRSNLWKRSQTLNNVRVERRDLAWTWNTDTTNQLMLRTGDVMNPLPWETFPNTVPNVSPDYPDIDRTHANFLVGQSNLALKPVALARPTVDTTQTPPVKKLNPTEIDLSVDVPRFQPANVNHHYFDINGLNGLNGVPNQPLLAPMDVQTGVPVDPANANLKGLIAPSAGYVGAYAVFVDASGTGTFQGFAPRVTRGQRVSRANGQSTYREMNVALAVPPDVNLRTEETTVDVGTVPHGLGYVPGLPFSPSYLFPYDGTVNGTKGAGVFSSGLISPWDSAQGSGQFFRPFTVRNQGNVNAVDVRVAKIIADYSTDPANPAFWSRLTSDQVQPEAVMDGTVYYTFNNPPLYGVRYQPYLPGAPGQIGIVSSLDHGNSTASFPGFDVDPTYSAQKPTGMWPFFVPTALQSYVVPGNPLDGAGVGWDNVKAGEYRRPTIHKPRPGDASGTTMSVPDVAWGDPAGLQASLLANVPGLTQSDLKPKVSIAVPTGTPAGTYSAPVYAFEDHQPEQWRQWVYYYRGLINSPDASPFTVASAPQVGDDDGMMNTSFPGGAADARMMPEARTNPSFTLKVRVAESRLTNGSSPGAFGQIDNRGGLPQFGANIQPAPFRDPVTGVMTLIWPSNRQWNGSNWVDPGTTDAPWYLVYSQLADIGKPQNNWLPQFFAPGVPGVFYDWQYANANQWWTPVTPAQQYPTPSAAVEQGLFPSQTSQLLPGADPNTPLVPGVMDQSLVTVRHATPAVAFVDDAKMAVPPSAGPGGNFAEEWMFWQGTVAKSASGAGSPQGFSYDTRTFYTMLKNGVPQDAAANPPYSFLNDPALPKFGPKPLIVKDKNGKLTAFLFWYGGGQDRTRLYYNASTDPTNVRTWTQDTILPTPGALQHQAEPTPIHRQVYTTWFNPAGEVIDVVDLVYTGVLPRKREPEALLTRYAIQYDAKGNAVLQVMPIGVTDPAPNGQAATPQTVWAPTNRELLAREGSAQIWSGRDLAWVYAANVVDPNDPTKFRRQYTHFDPVTGDVRPFIEVYVFDKNGQSRSNRLDQAGNPAPINLGGQAGDPAPIFDSATGRIIYASALGGQIVVDPQAGSVTFDGVAPRQSDEVIVAYTPQTLRLNTTRNDTNVVAIPGGNSNANTPWASDPAYGLKAHVDAPGANTSPVAFIDRSPNPRFSADPKVPSMVFPGSDPTQPVTVSRMWVIYRKSGSATTASSSLYYKTMRLMVRLPRGVIRNPDGSVNNANTQNLVVTGNVGPYEVDWVRGRVYFTDVDEGRLITVTKQNYTRDSNGNPVSVPPATYRVEWGDEISTAVSPGDTTTSETIVPTQSVVNEGQVSAFKDFFQDKVWLFWSSTRNGTTDLYYMTISPQFYPQPAQ